MTSAIDKMSMGVSATAAATNQNCVSERLFTANDVPHESCVDQTQREKSSGAVYIRSTVLSASSPASQTHPIVSFFERCLIQI